MSMENFGKYLLLEKVASGGMAEVYLAKTGGANGISKFVAIKRILPQYSDNKDFIEMFKEEAKIAVNLNHSNIVSIFDFGIEKHQFFLVMEFVEGQNLRQILNHLKKEAKDFSIDQIVYVVKEVAAGLDHAHRCLDGNTGRPLNITHRDMSPQNVMVSLEGEVKVVDFGIAKAETQLEQTSAGTIKGKFGYMSPEQAEGHVVDPRTDIFSLGIVLWELLANDRLFTAQNEAATLRKVRECQIPSLRKINPNIPPELERICMKALARDKSLRYQTAAAFHKDLNRFLNTQFPDFSAQDFSKFMKSLYHKMYLENRRKLAEYAKVQVQIEEATTVTSTMTATLSTPGVSAQSSEGTDSAEDRLRISSNSSLVDLNALKSDPEKPSPKVYVNPSPNTRSPMPGATMGPNPGTHSAIRTGTHSRIQKPMPPVEQSGSRLWATLAFVALVGGSFYLWKTNHLPFGNNNVAHNEPVSESPATVQGQGDMASQQPPVPVNIQSHPQGALVYINGNMVGITPYIGHIEAGREFHLTIHKDGFIRYERPTEKAGPGLYRFEANLQPEPPMGYVAIEVYNGGADPVITVNGQPLNDKSQLSRYAIPAGVPVRIRASNPFAQMAAEEVVTVGQSQKKTIKLYMSRQANVNSQ